PPHGCPSSRARACMNHCSFDTETGGTPSALRPSRLASLTRSAHSVKNRQACWPARFPLPARGRGVGGEGSSLLERIPLRALQALQAGDLAAVGGGVVEEVVQYELHRLDAESQRGEVDLPREIIVGGAGEVGVGRRVDRLRVLTGRRQVDR